jgi:hypothetical protein
VVWLLRGCIHDRSIACVLKEKEANLKEHVQRGCETSAAQANQVEEAKAAQQALREQVDKLQASQVYTSAHIRIQNHRSCATASCGRPQFG